MYLTFVAHLVKGAPCLVVTWPSIDIVDGSGSTLARRPGQPASSPALTLLDPLLEYHLGWASWCAPGPRGPFTAQIGILDGSEATLNIRDGFGPSGCQGGPSVVFVEPAW